MKILAIETSCDETAAAILDIKNNNTKVLSNIVSSQVKLHAKYGGVVPNLAAREHVKNIRQVFNHTLTGAGIRDFEKEINLIAVTRGPGLGPALLVGITFARTLAWKYNKPIIGVNHLEGHIFSNWLKPIREITNDPEQKSKIFNGAGNLQMTNKMFPALNLIVSGGHTELVLMRGYGQYKLIGETQDDAVGEAFDKVARLLDLGYPGGPLISKLAENGNPDIYPLPSPMIKSKDYNFSYSGLKTAVLYLVRGLKGSPSNTSGRLSAKQKVDIAASFEKAAIDVLVSKTMRATEELKVKSLLLSGGVSANKLLRKTLAKECRKTKIKYLQPELEYTGDNAAMIGLAGYMNYEYTKTPTDWKYINMDANLGFK